MTLCLFYVASMLCLFRPLSMRFKHMLSRSILIFSIDPHSGFPSFGSLRGNGALGSRFSRCISTRARASFFSNSCVAELSFTPASLASERLARRLVVV
jgi:hypothetical protein